jgi:hypothetical protein
MCRAADKNAATGRLKAQVCIAAWKNPTFFLGYSKNLIRHTVVSCTLRQRADRLEDYDEQTKIFLAFEHFEHELVMMRNDGTVCWHAENLQKVTVSV